MKKEKRKIMRELKKKGIPFKTRVFLADLCRADRGLGLLQIVEELEKKGVEYQLLYSPYHYCCDICGRVTEVQLLVPSKRGDWVVVWANNHQPV
ncbi:hypothetical protein [Persephonella sp.]